MNFEKRPNGAEVPGRVELSDALYQYPKSALLLQVEALSGAAYSALYNEYNRGTFTFNDFALHEEDSDIGNVSGLLTKLEAVEDEAGRRELAELIANTIVS